MVIHYVNIGKIMDGVRELGSFSQEEIVAALTNIVRDTWEFHARQQLRTSLAAYLDGLNATVSGRRGVVELTTPFANAIESGMPGFDMHDFIDNYRRVHDSKNGGKYVNVMIQRHEVMPEDPRVLRDPDSLIQDQIDAVRSKRSRAREFEAGFQSGMKWIRARRHQKLAANPAAVTWRRMSVTSRGKSRGTADWRHPGLPGVHIARKVRSDLSSGMMTDFVVQLIVQTLTGKGG